MRISEAFPSNYIKASDLQGRNITVAIDRVEFEKVGDDTKPIVFFQGKEKGLVLNKTNANTIAYAYGDDTAEWRDGEVILFETMVDFQGKSVPAVRVKIPPRRPVQQAQPRSARAAVGMPEREAPQRGGTSVADDLDDDIPF